MNIFVIDENPELAARSLCDKHVVKMILESAQLLSTTHHIIDGEELPPAKGSKKKRYKHHSPYKESILYKITHINHPCTIWTRETTENYEWLFRHFVEMCKEYTRRYGKIHACERNDELMNILREPPAALQSKGLTTFAQAMPDAYKSPTSAVDAYRTYYIHDKARFATWRIPEHKPEWFNI
jgi:hypothetical protein